MPAGDPALGGRREARERALSLLYEAEQKDLTITEVLDALPVPPDEYAEDLVRGVEANAEEIDAVITAAVTNWRLDRMAVLDRALLRQATYELLHRADVPVPVVLDEAVELAKRYGGDDSPRFVNGVLARVADDHPRES